MSESTALVKINEAKGKGYLVFVDEGWADEKTPLYKHEITEIKIGEEACFNLQGKYMPRREVFDAIGEASGVDFILGETYSAVVEDTYGKRTVYRAVAQGRRMMSDGSYRTSSKCAYEFDPVLRAMSDYKVTELNAQTKQMTKYENGPTLARYILELQKVAAQRANTGARLRVIRELVKVPTAFTKAEIAKPMCFGRMVLNTDFVLKTPEGRAMATAKALGIDMSTIFGGKKPALTNEAETPAGEADYAAQGWQDVTPADTESEDIPDFTDAALNHAGNDEFLSLTNMLEGYVVSYKDYLNKPQKDGSSPYALAEAELVDKGATIESRKLMIERVKAFLIRNGAQGVA